MLYNCNALSTESNQYNRFFFSFAFYLVAEANKILVNCLICVKLELGNNLALLPVRQIWLQMQDGSVHMPMCNP